MDYRIHRNCNGGKKPMVLSGGARTVPDKAVYKEDVHM